MMWRRRCMELFSPPPLRTSAWFVLRSCSTLQTQKAKLNIDQHVNSNPRHRRFRSRGIQQTLLQHRRLSTNPTTQSGPLSEGVIPPTDCEVRKAVTSFLPSVVTVTLSTSTSKKKYCGIIVDPLGYIVTSAKDMESQSKQYLSRFKVDVHLNPGMPSEYTLSGELSYANLVNKFTIVKCKSDKPLQAAKLNNSDHRSSDLLLYLYTTCVQNKSSLVADLVKIVRPEDYRPFPFEIVKSCIFSSSAALADDFGLAIVNLDGELVGIFKDCVTTDLCAVSKIIKEKHLCATSANVVSKVLGIAKKHGTYQPWIGIELYLIDKKYHTCYVRTVTPDSPADEAGVKVGHQIIQLGLSIAPSFVEIYNESLFKLRRPLLARLDKNDGYVGYGWVNIVPCLKEQAETPIL